MCLRDGDPDGVQEEHRRLYWFGPKNALRPVGEGSLVLSYTEVLIVGVTTG
jgi:hypothetical protein